MLKLLKHATPRVLLLLCTVACSRSPSGAAGANELRLVTPEGHTGPVYAASYSPDGRRIVTASDDGTARIWEAATGREVRRFEPARPRSDTTAWVRSAAFSPDGRVAITGSRDGVARLWNSESGQVIDSLTGHSGGITSVAFSGDGRFVITASHDSTARLWRASTRRTLRRFVGHTGGVTSVALSLDGLRVVTASRDSTARLWNATTGAPLITLRGHAGWVTSAAVSPDDRLIVTGSMDGTARLWNAAAGHPIQFSNGQWELRHPSTVVSAVFSPDGRFLLTASDDGVARLWETTSGRQVRQFGQILPERHLRALRSAGFSSDGRRVITASMDKTARLWAIAGDTVHLIRTLGGQVDRPLGVSFSPDGKMLATASDGRTARIWDLATGREMLSPLGHGGPVWSAGFSPDARLIVTTSRTDNLVGVWNASTGDRLHDRIHHPDSTRGVWSAGFSPDGRLLVTSSDDGTARIWETASGRQLRRIEYILPGGDTAAWVNSAALSPGARFVATSSYDTTVRVWVATDSQVRQLPRAANGGHSDLVWSTAFSPDAKFLLTGSDDGTARLWDIATVTTGTVREARRLRGHRGFIRSAAFSDDGRVIATASHDGTARLWDASTGRERRVLVGHTGWVNSVAISPDGRFVATASNDGTTRLWNATTGAEIFSRFALDSLDWVVVAPDGRFDGSEGGMRRLHYARGWQTLSLDAFFEQFYTPGLAGLLLHGAPYNGPDIRRGYRQPPAVRIVSPLPGETSDTAVTVVVEVKDNGGGSEDVRLYHNGALRPTKSFRASENYCAAGAVCYALDVELLAGENILEATAFANDRTEAERAEVTLVVSGPKPVARLHVFAVGINTYRNRRYNLNYGRDDATAFAAALVSGRESSSGSTIFADVRVDTLFDSSATRANITAAFERIAARARPQDVFVFFYAGHGTTARVGNKTRFFLVPTDVVQATEPRQLLARGVSDEELRRLFEAIPARKKVIVVDACQSGELVAQFGLRGPAEARAIAQLGRNSGLFVMSSTDSEQFAREVNTLGHGILTSALLAALEGDNADTRGVRTVREIMTDAEWRTHELSVTLRGESQRPLVHSNGMDFQLVMVQRGVKRDRGNAGSLAGPPGTAAPAGDSRQGETARACECAPVSRPQDAPR